MRGYNWRVFVGGDGFSVSLGLMSRDDSLRPPGPMRVYIYYMIHVLGRPPGICLLRPRASCVDFDAHTYIVGGNEFPVSGSRSVCFVAEGGFPVSPIGVFVYCSPYSTSIEGEPVQFNDKASQNKVP